MDPFKSETDDESATKPRTLSSLRKSIRKRKIRLTHELNSDSSTNSPEKAPTFGRTKRKISNSFLPQIDNVALVSKVILQKASVVVHKKKVKRLEMHKLKILGSINKKSKSKSANVSTDKENSVDFSDFFRKCSVILTRITSKQMEDALKKHTASCQEGEAPNVKSGSPRRSSKQGRLSSTGKQKEDVLKKPTSLSREGGSLEDVEMAKEATGASRRSLKHARSLSTCKQKEDALNKHAASSYDGDKLENVENAKETAGSPRTRSSSRSSSTGKKQEDALKNHTSLSHEGESLEDVEMAKETMGVARRSSKQGRSLSTGNQKEDTLNKHAASYYEGDKLENVKTVKETAGSPRSDSKLGQSSSTGKKQDASLSEEGESLEDVETAKETTGVSRRRSKQGPTSPTDLNATFEIPEEEIKICKSILQKSTSRSPNSNAHRVTFNVTSMVMDNFNTPIPTRFPLDNEKGRISRNIGKTSFPIKTPTNASKKVVSPAVNKLHAGQTPANLKSTDKKVLKKGTMPDYSKIHQKMYDKMLNIQDYKDQKIRRAKLLLSGRKPDSVTKTNNLPQTSSVKKEVHRKLSFSRVPTSNHVLNNSKNVSKNKSPTRRREQELSIKNKNHPVRGSMENIRTEIKGMRSNRRFELLMKFRRGQ